MDEPTMDTAFTIQADACRALGSVLYADLLSALAPHVTQRGVLHDLLRSRPERPVRDAVPLRLLGAVHRLVLRGDAPDLAARYPSAGGDGTTIEVEAFLAVVAAHRDEVDTALGTQVQTNEVGRAAALTAGFAVIDRLTGLPRHLLEIGASAGLNLNADRYWYDTGTSTAGDPASTVRFDDVWQGTVDVGGLGEVVARHGCDISPVDPTDPAGRQRLLSFVWPDQVQRFERLHAALAIAARHPPTVTPAGADDWLADQLADRPADGAATVVYHSIVWQYLSPAVKDAVRGQLADHGRRASWHNPLVWLRMEPDGPVASLRLTVWRGGAPEETPLGHCGYHGAAVTLNPPDEG